MEAKSLVTITLSAESVAGVNSVLPDDMHILPAMSIMRTTMLCAALQSIADGPTTFPKGKSTTIQALQSDLYRELRAINVAKQNAQMRRGN